MPVAGADGPTGRLLTHSLPPPPRPHPLSPQDVCARYEAMGWHVQHVKDGNHDLEGLRAAIQKAKVRRRGRPA